MDVIQGMREAAKASQEMADAAPKESGLREMCLLQVKQLEEEIELLEANPDHPLIQITKELP